MAIMSYIRKEILLQVQNTFKRKLSNFASNYIKY